MRCSSGFEYTRLDGLLSEPFQIIERPVKAYLDRSVIAGLLVRSVKDAFRPLPRVRIQPARPAGDPLVSIVIPTYNRSEVLRITIDTVLWQSEQNFELIIVGDGCTDDTEAVLRSIGDARIRWHNLPANSGHQSAPNNAGFALSRGKYIAQLGHDDIWHPEHLRTLLETLGDDRADFAMSLMENRGGPGSSYKEVSGSFSGGRYDPIKCSAPSALMFRRSVYEKIGDWLDYRKIPINPECDYQYRAYLAGFRMASTRALTVFKFNSTFFRNCYIEKPCEMQRQYRERILSQRTFLLRETLDIAQVHLRKLPMYAPAVPPAPEPNTPGWHISYYRKLRGLDDK